MNYSIIFKGISFYLRNFNSVTDNLNNSYDNLDYARIRQRRVGSLSVLAPGSKHNETSTDKKNLSVREHPWGTFGSPLFKGRKEGLQVPRITR